MDYGRMAAMLAQLGKQYGGDGQRIKLGQYIGAAARPWESPQMGGVPGMPPTVGSPVTMPGQLQAALARQGSYNPVAPMGAPGGIPVGASAFGKKLR